LTPIQHSIFARAKRFFFGGLFVFCLALPTNGMGQDLTAYTTPRGHFYAFYKGQAIQLSHLEPASFKIAKNYLVYTSNSGSLMLYQPSRVSEPGEIAISAKRINVSEGYLAFEVHGQLRLYANNKLRTLSTSFQKWEAADSTVCWFDNTRKQLLIFQNNKTKELEDALLNEPILNFEVADNLVAYTDNHHQLLVYYKKEKHYLCQAYPPMHFKVAKNLVAFIDRSAGTFNLFYKGDIMELSAFRPLSYRTADNRLAFVDNSGRFFLFDEGNLAELSSFAPDKYWLTDDLLVYFENREFVAHWKGESYNLESYMPDGIKVHKDAVCYLNDMQQLVIFQDGKKEIISYDTPSSFYLHYNTVVYYKGNSMPHVYYKGSIYK